MNTPIHLDLAVSNLARLLEDSTGVSQALLIEDSLGRVSVGIWSNAKDVVSEKELVEAAGSFFSGTVFHASEHPRGSLVDLEEAWEEATPARENGQELPKVRRVVRFRTLTSWQYQQDPIWPLSPDEPAIVTFYSYKGGLGRTTALVSFAIQRARLGERVAILDLDLEAPGLDLLERHCEPIPDYGIVDYLLESHHIDSVPFLQDFYGTVSHPDLVGAGSIAVFAAGKQDDDYLGKVSRIDLEWRLARESGFPHPLESALVQIKEEMRPDWILIDSRTGFSEVSGLLLSGFAHLHVLFGVQSQQSWNGLERVISRLGAQRLGNDSTQSDAFLVQAMLQDKASQTLFEERADTVFLARYYRGQEMEGLGLEAREGDDLDLLDAEGDDAPHKPEGIPYLPAFSQEVDLTDSVKLRALLSGEYRSLADRIARRTGREEQDGEE
jgi:hypothetical protein